MISLTETFVSIQGEGLSVGKPAFFIRTGTCSIQCKLCDTSYSWNSAKKVSISHLTQIVKEQNIPTIIITGGEPLEEKDINILIEELSKLKNVKEIIVETCGAIFRNDLLQQKLKLVVSPKPPSMKENFPVENALKLLKFYENSELKIGVLTGEDFYFAKNLILKAKPFLSLPPVIQPIETPEESYSETVKKVIQIVLSDKEFINETNVRIIPQIHKLIGIK
ncbi:7-carboxy-7-deazaguanine synthase [Desulfurobacterium pacificum]|uniref:7-carboxy-7-deazaguanine synthase n=1 Tax=Desulfurobacterium pacificum TaxID=240166 RepID=A0ABY1NUP5_9BACT|nr:7-carboxy-7-deazaguanine synthase QueE [Desulfurobacterium pacificum]SMP18741.1 7-carboxy-7-deazaguanine synthase [Desulfurobacterium pacificum]